jgi:uncharacterized protein (TIRG00374 family)
MTVGVRRTLRVLFYLGIVVLLLAFARHVDWRGAAVAVRGADPTLLALATLANLVSLALKGVRWWVFLRPLGVRSLALVMRATFAGASLNNLLVAQGGEGARVLLVSRSGGVSSARVLAALAMERVLDIVTYLLLLVGAIWLLDVPPMIARWRVGATIALAIAVAMIALLGAGGKRSTLAKAPRSTVIAIRPSWVERLRSYVARFARGLADIASPARLLVAMLLSLGAWALQLATYHLTALAAHLPLPITGSLVALLAVGVSFLVRATPGNVGIFQVAYALAAQSFGVPEGPAVAVALLIQTLQVIPTVVGGTIASPRLMKR